jgi:UDP-N-acetylglucosamine:LPS N-acetylglucosamine transferase
MKVSAKQLATGLCALALPFGVAACGETVSTNSFKGESHKVAETVSNLENDATALDQQKVCDNDLAATLTMRLGGSSGCQASLKKQLREIDALTMTIKSIAVSGNKASARVQSAYSGKNRTTTLLLVKEGSHWKVSGVQ